MLKRIYVAATSQHVGKTTSTLGLVSTLNDIGINVGYCKPVGQQFVDLGNLKVDKDVLLFEQIIGFGLVEEVHSPVILGKGATSAYLENPSKFHYRQSIIDAQKVLETKHEVVVYEGTGHPGVGSVVGLSNAEVAKMLGASVIMVVKGGIGNTIDRMMLSICGFQRKNVPIAGIIINKVLPSKMDKIEYYVGKKLKELGIPLLGLLPYDKSLTNPIMETVRVAVKGDVIANEDKMTNMVEDIVSGSLIDTEAFSASSNHLLVVNPKRLCDAIDKIKAISLIKGLDKSPLSGIIITGEGGFGENSDLLGNCSEYVAEHGIPVISTHLDTFGAVVKISKIEVKINTKTPWKSAKAIELIKEYVDLSSIIG